MVTGTLFTFISGTAGLLSGYLTDMLNRKYFLMIGAFVWTTFSFTISFVQTYSQLLFARMGFALFISASIPPSVSLISDYYPPD
mmetsp:Transcript_513/g.303  ORF Transcript_513/g.303 Transcript_513/m.303 type:complete len:84 (-) Transcript_513:1082-1333(-)